MIVTQSHHHRTLVGSLNVDTDLIDALRNLCVDNSVLCGFFQATGYVEDASLRLFDAAKKSYRDLRLPAGTFHVASLTGNISLIDRQTAIVCHAQGTLLPADGGPPTPVTGELTAGRIVGIEFMLTALDDLRLYRALDDRSGLNAWLHIEFTPPTTAAPHPNPSPTLPPATPTAATAPPAPSSRPPDPIRDESRPDLRAGDFLNHPTLGRCVVVRTEDEDRIIIRLESGRNVELHTGLVDITPTLNAPDGERTFSVAIRRRR